MSDARTPPKDPTRHSTYVPKEKKSTKAFHPTPMLDQLESGPWPSFVTGLKRLAHENNMMVDLLGQLEHSYKTRLGYWKGGTVSVFGYGGGIIPRFSEVASMFPESKEFHTLRVQPPAGNHYTTKLLRQLSTSWSKWGSGLIAFHGQTGNIMFIGSTSENTQHFFDEINEYGFDLGGAGPCVRTAMSCVGAARCEQSCTNEHRIHRTLVNNFIDDMHRPALPYKFKFKVSGCPNDCMNSIQRADFAVIGTWRDDMQVDQKGVKEYIKGHGRKYTIDNVITRCPTKALSLNDDDTLEVDNKSCVRCMHCINVMTKALKPGTDRGITLLIGGKRTLKIGDTMGTVIVPFMKMDTDEDYEKLRELAATVIDFWAENGLEHERCGEMIERIGLAAFLEGIGVEVDPNMIAHPRTSSYVRLDDWDQEAQKWIDRKNQAAAKEIAVAQAQAVEKKQMRTPIESGCPDGMQYMHPLMIKNFGNWKYHDRPRPGVLHHVAYSGDEIWTVRVGTQRQLGPYEINLLCDIVDKYGEGHVRFTIRSNLEVMVSKWEKVGPLIQAFNDAGYPVGGTGNSVTMISHTQGWLHCDIPGTDASGVVKSLMDELYEEFIKEEMPNRVHITTSCCQINCGGQGDIAINVQHTKPPKINHDLVANVCERPSVVARCPVAAIRPAIVNGKPSLEVDEKKCICCGACYPPCPPMQINDPEHSKLAIWVGGKNSNARSKPMFQKLVAAGLPNNPPRWPEVAAVVKKILYTYKKDARHWERVGDWVERIGWPRFFELTGLPFTKFHIDNWRGARNSLNASAHIRF